MTVDAVVNADIAEAIRVFLLAEPNCSEKARHEIAEEALSWPKPPTRPVKTIAVFYHRFYAGGVERVISEQFKYFRALGYKVILITEEQQTSRDFSLSEGIVREFVSIDPVKRVDDLKRIFKGHAVDLYYTHASFAKQTLWDLLIVRYLLGIRVLVHAHGIFPCSLAWGDDDLRPRLDYYRLADQLITLSRADAFYYQAYGIPAMYIPNPVPEIPMQGGLEKVRFTSKLVLSIGRVCSVKRTLDVLITAEAVRKLDSSVKFLIVGSREDVNYWSQVQKYYRHAGLGDTVNFLDYTLDVQSIYRKGSVLLVTSQLEGFPMVMAEAKGYGLPVVSYDMPYVEFMREDNSGVLTVPHGDCEALARQICHLLDDEGLYRRQSAASRASYERIPSGLLLRDMFANAIVRVMQDVSCDTDDRMADAKAAFEALVAQMRASFKVAHNRGWTAGSHAAQTRILAAREDKMVAGMSRVGLLEKVVFVLRTQGLGGVVHKACKKLKDKMTR